ncbi:MAG: hypothetical protein V1871_04675 [Planctomycetota bacterium]
MITSRNIVLKILGAILFYGVISFVVPSVILAQDITSTESFLKKYTLTESFELGMETAFMLPHSGRTNNMGNLYLTLTHSVNTYSSFKFKTGILNGEYLLYNQNLGRIYFVPLQTTFISSLDILGLENPKPYYGMGIGYYFFDNFKSVQTQYRTFEGENTYGYHFLVGAKYLSSWGLLFRSELAYESIKPYRFFNSNLGAFGTKNVRRIDFSNMNLTLNAAFYF